MAGIMYKNNDSRRNFNFILKWISAHAGITLLVFLLFLPASASAQEAIGINFFDLANSNVNTSGLTCWGNGKAYAWTGAPTTFLNCTGETTGGDVPVDMSIGAGSLVFTTTRPGGSGWSNIQFKLDGGHTVNFLRYGDSPFMHLRLKWGAIASGANYIIRLYDDHAIWNNIYAYNGLTGPYSSHSAGVYMSNYVAPSTNWQDVYIPISDFVANNPNIDLTRISIVEFSAIGNYSTTNTIYIEKFRIIRDIANQYTDMIKVNMLGYQPNGKKLAIVSYEGTISPAPSYFQVRDAQTDSVVYQSNLTLKTSCSSTWNKSGDTTYYADFTAFTTPGRYYIYCPELNQQSVDFTIGKKAFDSAFRDSLRFFYHARSGQAIVEPYAEGHPRMSVYANNSACRYDYDDNNTSKKYDYDPNNIGITTRDVQGGWFDAGDLHLDVHNNVTTMWFLLETLEQFQNKLGPDVLNLPESDGQINDLILLIKWELDWFKKMQNANGSVHFIVTAITQDGSYYQQVSDISTGSASILAGTFAKAYVLLKDVPGMESYANDLLARAQLSWNWLMANTAVYVPIMKYGGDTEYYAKPIDTTTEDSYFRQYAAVELYIATGNTTYKTYFESRYSSANNYMQGITALGKAHIDYAETTRPVNSTIRTAIRNKFTTLANTLATNVDCNPYRIPVSATGDIGWGSSGLIACNAYTLLRVYEWTGDIKYKNAALDALEWIAGRNPVNRIFITGYGDYIHGTDIYSFYSYDLENIVPGYLCGNVNTLDFLGTYIKYPYKYYLNIQNASTLEPCLPWQAELCYLLGYFAYDLKLTGDVTLDGAVNYSDVLKFANAWLSTPDDENWNASCDIAMPKDSIINFLDFAVLANQWLQQ